MAAAVLAISTFLQYLTGGLAGWIAVSAERPRRFAQAWTIVACGLTLMAVRRSISLGRALTGSAEPDLAAESVGLLISVLMLAGVLRLSGRIRALARRENTLEREREQQRIIFDSAPGLVCLKDTDNRLIRVNRRTTELLGVGRELIEGKTVEEIWPEQAAASREQDQQVIASDRPLLGVEQRARTPDGRDRWFRIDRIPHHNADGEVQGIVVFSRDITAQRLAQDKLSANEARLRSLVEGTATTVGAGFLRSLTKHLAEAIDVRWSFVCRHVGTPATKVEILSMWDRKSGEVEPFQYPLAGTPCERVAVAGKAYFASGVAAEFPEDTWLQENNVDAYIAVALVDGAGRRLGHVGILHDAPLAEDPSVADVMSIFASRAAAELSRMQAERERRDIEEQMQQAQRLESLGVLAGGIAHDFNNLLSGVLGHANLALMELGSDSPTRRHLQQIERAAHRAAGLTRQMLAYAGRGSMERTALDLSELVEETADLLGLATGKQVEVHFDVAPDLPHVIADANQVRQVVMNLLTNASEAVQEVGHGEIRVSTGVLEAAADELKGPHGRSPLPPGRYVWLDVEDSGSGMDAATRARIFEPFYTTKFQGRGLGLAAVLGIVRSHGGTLEVESRKGEGSRFRILLPGAELAAAVASENGEDVTPAPISGTVLIIDDEDLPREVARELLQMQGLRVVTASNGEEGIEKFEAGHEEIGCVLLDLTMPGLTGREVLERLRARVRGIGVVLMSGYDEREARGRAAGRVAGFLQKPFSAESLVAEVRRVLSR